MKRLTISKNRSRAQRDSLACFCSDEAGQIFTCVQTFFCNFWRLHFVSKSVIFGCKGLGLEIDRPVWQQNKKETIVTNVNFDWCKKKHQHKMERVKPLLPWLCGSLLVPKTQHSFESWFTKGIFLYTSRNASHGRTVLEFIINKRPKYHSYGKRIKCWFWQEF